MNKRQKEVQQTFLDNEKAVLKKLESNYQDALDEINSKIELLLARQDADMQHVIYQVEYQKALKTQVQAILEQLQANEFETVSEYLANSYHDGFIGTMYDLQGQGIPLVFPIDQEQVVAAIQHETKLSTSLYTALGKDIKDLNKKIAGEISRGISTGMMYSEIARNVSNWAGIPKNNAMRIARTEAHRIQCKATADAQFKAKEKGANVVKQWDSALDGNTRPHHRQLDGQIRELEEPFEVGGMEVMMPGAFGIAGEDVNCRCALLQRARWALGNDYTKWSEDAPVVISDDGTTQFVHIDAGKYSEFKEKYLYSLNMATKNNGIDWGAKGTKITNEQYKAIMKHARDNNIELSGFKYFDGQVETVMELIDDANEVAKIFPEITSGKKKLTIALGQMMDSVNFAEVDGHIITVNANAYRNVEKLKEEYQKLMEAGWFVKGTDYHAIIKHEIGHVVANYYGIDCMELAKEVTGFKKNAEVILFLEQNLSEYAGAYMDGREIISECFASMYNSNIKNEFVLKFLEKYVNIIKNR